MGIFPAASLQRVVELGGTGNRCLGSIIRSIIIYKTLHLDISNRTFHSK